MVASSVGALLVQLRHAGAAYLGPKDAGEDVVSPPPQEMPQETRRMDSRVTVPRMPDWTVQRPGCFTGPFVTTAETASARCRESEVTGLRFRRRDTAAAARHKSAHPVAPRRAERIGQSSLVLRGSTIAHGPPGDLHEAVRHRPHPRRKR